MARYAANRNMGTRWHTLRPQSPQVYLPGNRWLIVGIVGLCVLVMSSWATAQTPSKTSANPLDVPPRSWVVDVVQNELTALHHPNSYLRFRMHIVDAKGDRVRDVIESKDGSVARMILKDGRPLTDDEDKDERKRLNDMLASPDEFAKHIKDDASGKKLADQLMRLMPDAMIYSYTPGQPQTGKNRGALEVVIDYKPNPKFSPPITAAEALTGLQGRVWVDAESHHLIRMEGTVFRAVNFGWGMLAHIYPGGQLSLEQTDVGNNRWIFTHFHEDIKIRALMLKTLHIHSEVEAGSFQTLPGPMSYQDAIRVLLNTPLPSK